MTRRAGGAISCLKSCPLKENAGNRRQYLFLLLDYCAPAFGVNALRCVRLTCPEDAWPSIAGPLHVRQLPGFASSSVTTSKSAAGTPRTSGAVLVAVAIGDEADLQPKALASSFYEYAA
jgi:hypothetical protein